MNSILFISILVSFIAALLIMPRWIRKCNKIGLLWEDMNKYKHPKNVAASGGIVVVMAFILGVLSYVAIRTFIINDLNGISLQIFALLSVVLILAIVGLTDDLLGWKHGGLSAQFRIFLVLFASIPLVVINAGTKLIEIPFFGEIELGLLYPLIIIPLGITGATTVYNFLAGFNGLEVGQGIIIISFLSFISYVMGSAWLSLVGLCMVASLLVFYYYNKHPAKVFPGDVLTYSIGAVIACMAILGNFERIAIFVFIPYIIEFILKSRGNLKKQSFGIPNKDGSLEMPYDKIYGLTHLSIFILQKFKKKVYEKDVTYLIFSFQIIICLLALVIFKESLFNVVV
ncbi:MAG: glycosyl transferase family 4 [Nanoarchaeota archaeon]|nr:glycosyl transferase family 4 [Nanoarchaeota archaeon]